MSFHSQAAEAKERMEMDDEERQGTVCENYDVSSNMFLSIYLQQHA